MARRAAPARRLRILVVSHSHPAVSHGGAEIAAFQLFEALRDRVDCEAWFLGCDRTLAAERPGAVLSQPFSDAEWVYAAGAFDWFKFANPDPRFPREVTELFRRLSPDVVHFHHYINLGVEVFQHLRQALPHCRIVLTLHEYLGICHHYGQMLKTEHDSLCHAAGPRPCQACFPVLARSDFFLRQQYIRRYFGLVDQFTSPSRFLAARYAAWGVPAERMAVLENLLPAAPGTVAGPDGDLAGGEVLRIGFFGQISNLKGMGVLMAAATALDAAGVRGVAFDIHGDDRGQPPAFRAAFAAQLASAPPSVRYHGAYGRSQVDRLMRGVHAVLVPSIWWENSPVVIQEALRNRRPVLCSDIGGMAEKVRDGVDGLHFRAGDPVALAGLVRRLLADRAGLAALAGGMVPPAGATAADYLALYAVAA